MKTKRVHFPISSPFVIIVMSVYLVVPLHRNDTWLGRSFSQQPRYFITPVVCCLHILNTCQSFFFAKVLLRFIPRSVFNVSVIYRITSRHSHTPPPPPLRTCICLHIAHMYIYTPNLSQNVHIQNTGKQYIQLQHINIKFYLKKILLFTQFLFWMKRNALEIYILFGKHEHKA